MNRIINNNFINNLLNILRVRIDNAFLFNIDKFIVFQITPVAEKISLEKSLFYESFFFNTISMKETFPIKKVNSLSDDIFSFYDDILTNSHKNIFEYVHRIYGRIFPSQLLNTSPYFRKHYESINEIQEKISLLPGDEKYRFIQSDMFLNRFYPNVMARIQENDGRYGASYDALYPKIQSILVSNPMVISETKETAIEKIQNLNEKTDAKNIDVDKLANQILQLIERKIKIEKERRGL